MILALPLILLSACTGLQPLTSDSGAPGDDTGVPDGADGGTSDGGAGDGGDDGPTVVDQPDERSCTVTVTHDPAGSPGSVQVAGSFSGWEPVDMADDDGDGVWQVALEGLAAGEYAYKFVVDGSWESEIPVDVETHWEGGIENRNLRVGDCTVPALALEEAWATGDGGLYARVQVLRAEGGAAIDPDSVQVTVGGQPVEATFDEAEGTVQVDLSGLPPGKHTVRVWAADEAGQDAENQPLFVPLWVETEPWDWDDSLMYFVFTDRFRNGDYGAEPQGPTDGVDTCANYAGGDYQGVIDALEEGYFEDLGVNTLWLSPVYENPEGAWLGIDGVHWFSGYHGYWPLSHDSVQDRHGDADADAEARLQELIDLAHAKGIRVMFDLVLNHVHEDHAYVDEHPEWFGGGCVCGTHGCGWDEMARTCWFTDYLPDLDYRNHAITQRVLQDTLQQLARFDVDAVRVDAAKHMDHVIMRTLNSRLNGELSHPDGPSWYLVGETFTQDRGLLMDYVGEHELDGQFDFPMLYAVRNAFIHGGSFRDLEASVADGQASYGGALMSPFLGNHDVDRFASEISGQAGDCWSGWTEDPMADGSTEVTQWDIVNRQSMALAFTLTQPGVPLLYYGDEIGLHGMGDPDNRRVMSFDPYLSGNQAELLARAQVVGRARAASPALRRGERVQLWVDDDLLVYALVTADDVAIVALNKSDAPRSASVPLQERVAAGTALQDLKVEGRSFATADGNLALELGGWDWALLRASW